MPSHALHIKNTTSAQSAVVIINTENTEIFRLTNDGNLSIGSVAPAYKLDVQGTLGVSGAANFSSSIQAGGGTTNASAVLQADSTTKGFLPPRMTSTQRAAISTPSVGLVVYQTDGTEGLYIYTNANGWKSLAIVN